VTQERLFHAVGAILAAIILGAVYVGYEWGVILVWSLVEALRNG
jgi:hypothetical protein